MSLVRDDARRVCSTRRQRAYSRPARSTGPALLTIVLAALAATLLIAAGSSALVIVGAVALIAIIGAVAAHRTTASLFYGVALRLVQPFQPGERIRLYSTESRQFIDAVVVRIGFVNTTLATDSGVLVVPNTRMLRTPCAV